MSFDLPDVAAETVAELTGRSAAANGRRYNPAAFETAGERGAYRRGYLGKRPEHVQGQGHHLAYSLIGRPGAAIRDLFHRCKEAERAGGRWPAPEILTAWFDEMGVDINAPAGSLNGAQPTPVEVVRTPGVPDDRPVPFRCPHCWNQSIGWLEFSSTTHAAEVTTGDEDPARVYVSADPERPATSGAPGDMQGYTEPHPQGDALICMACARKLGVPWDWTVPYR